MEVGGRGVTPTKPTGAGLAGGWARKGRGGRWKAFHKLSTTEGTGLQEGPEELTPPAGGGGGGAAAALGGDRPMR